MKDFRSLAEASNIIEDINKKATIMFEKYVQNTGTDVVGKISSYLSKFFEPLYNLKALEDHCLALVGGVTISSQKDYETYNKTKEMTNMYVLSLNIPLGGHRTFLKLIFREGESVKVEGDINELTISLLIRNWHNLKTQMENHCENAIRRFNENCKRNVDEMAKLQNQIESFEV
jgi:hypothetical protein